MSKNSIKVVIFCGWVGNFNALWPSKQFCLDHMGNSMYIVVYKFVKETLLDEQHNQNTFYMMHGNIYPSYLQHVHFLLAFYLLSHTIDLPP